jgi:hypothetical protein
VRLNRPLRRGLLACAIAAGAGAVLYLGSVVGRTARAYSGLKTGGGWTGGLYEADPELGFRLAPGSIGVEVLPSGRTVSVRVDERGLRVPLDRDASRARDPARDGVLVLALGDSFTFGQACEAESAFPYLVSRELGAECLNTGCPSYGLAQMLVLARHWIPRTRPSILLLQHSPWLAGRAQRDTAPTLLRSVPTPYFDEDGRGVALRPPRFRTLLFDLPVESFRESPRGATDFVSFFAKVGMPLLLHDDGARCLAWAKEGRRPPPSEAAVEESVHAEIAELCQRAGSLLVIVEIGKGCGPIGIEAPERRPGSLVVDARAALCAELPPGDRNAYYERYAHFTGDPPVLEDAHPNELAHALIAEAVVRAIESSRR